MAKINAQQKHGSVGGSTFVSSPDGLIERQRVVPRDPRTPAQQHIRGLVAACAAGWGTLSDAQRAGWRALAGQLPGRLAGSHLYTRLNVVRANCGLPLLEAAPPPPAFGILVCTGLVVDDTPSVRLLQVTDTVAPEAFILDACPSVSPGREYVERLFRQVAVVPGHAGPGVDLDITAAYIARVGPPLAGERVFVRLSAMTHGFRNGPLQVSALVGKGAA